MARKQIWLGYKVGSEHWPNCREVFRSDATPTQATHGDRYAACVGPFRTVRAAEFMRTSGWNNPHCVTVQQAERLARRRAQENRSCRSK